MSLVNKTSPLKIQVRTGPNQDPRQFIAIEKLMNMIRNILKALDPCKATIMTNDSTMFTGSR